MVFLEIICFQENERIFLNFVGLVLFLLVTESHQGLISRFSTEWTKYFVQLRFPLVLF